MEVLEEEPSLQCLITGRHMSSGSWMVVSTYPSEKYEFVSWDDYSPNIWTNKIHVPNHQPVMLLQNKLVIAAGFEVLVQLMATQMGIP
jgi:hypothetical protein